MLSLNDTLIAMTDLETSGDVFGLHEILEIGVVVFNQKNFEIIDTLNIKVKPLNIKNAIPAALERNGYNEKDWSEAVSLGEAMEKYAEKTTGCIFSAYNATFDWGFVNTAFKQTKVQNKMDYHRLDVLSIAWEKGLKNSPKWNLSVACEIFGVLPEPMPHSALNGAMTAYELFKKLSD